jgi:hypothetical protein
LDWTGPGGKKADAGTIVHKILEVMALAKKAKQQGQTHIDDDIVGNFPVNYYDIKLLITRVYTFYTTERFHYHKWTWWDLKFITDSVWKALKFNGGMFDPRKRNIEEVEFHFDLQMPAEWSHYSYKFRDATIEGELSIKGTVDLITKIDDNTLEIIDWKTGKNKDIKTGEEKNQEYLQTDPQLLFYYYAITRSFPDIKNIIVTIYFINSFPNYPGGPFTLAFDHSDFEKAERLIKHKFDKIKANMRPKLINEPGGYFCKNFCNAGMTTFAGTRIEPIMQTEQGIITGPGQTMTQCEQIGHEIEQHGIDFVTDKYAGDSFTKYYAPGG